MKINKISEKISEDSIQFNHENNEYKKILIREFIINDILDVNHMLKILNETPIIALINVKKLRKNESEFKIIARSLKGWSNRIKGDIAFIGKDLIILTPSFAEIYRGIVKDRK